MHKLKLHRTTHIDRDRRRHRHLQSRSPTTKEDIDRHKRVMFVALEKDSPISCRLEDSYITSAREKEATTFADNDPKTSEYAFFKKLKKDAGRQFHSCPLQKDASLPKKPEANDYSKERTEYVRVGSKVFNTSKIVEEMPTVETDSYLPPSDGGWNKSGNQYVHGKIFTRKRQKLRQCVSDALFPDAEKFSLKGHDIVSMLLSRLFPMSIKENKYEDLNPGKGVNVTGYDLLDFSESNTQFEEPDQRSSRKLEQSSLYFSNNLLSPTSDERITAHAAFPASHSHNFQPPSSITEPEYKFPSSSSKCDASLGFLHNEVTHATRYGLLDSQQSDVQPKEHHQIPKMKLPEFEPNSCVRDHSMSPVCLRSNERMIPEASFLTSHSHKYQLPNSITEPEYDFGGIPIFTAKRDVSLEFLLDEQGHDTFKLDHFKELGKHERKPIPLLLEKDFDFPTGAINLPIAYEYPKPDAVPSLSTFGIGEEMLKNILGECHFSPSSLLLDKPQHITSILDSGLLRYQEFRFGRYIYEEKDEMDMNINHTLLPLSHKQHYLKLSADCESNSSCVQDCLDFSPYQHWITRTAYNDYHHHPDSEAWLSSSFISGQRCLSLTSWHSNYQGSNYNTLELSQREKDVSSSLFQIDNNLEPEMDGGNHAEVLYRLRKGFVDIYNSCFLQMSMQRINRFPLPLDGSDNINELEHTHNMIV